MADRGFRVVVAGAGVAGLFMAETLKRAGIDFTVYEKAGEVGGTWRDNTFPGLFVDVLSRQYEFPFQPNYNWSRKYAPAGEIWAYIKKVARDRGLTKFIRFNEEVTAARFTEGRWHIETGKGNTDIADVFVCATGFLQKPRLPDIAGRDSFAGPSFHSARWDHSVPYPGKRWGVIGSGASGVQITEALAWAGCDVTQFIRRAQWVHIRDNPYSTWRERLKLRLPGFDAHAYMRPMNVTGLNGVTIEAAWQEKIYSYGGIALPGFPNLFMLYGPFSPVNNVPVPLGLDQEIGCIMRLIGEARARSAAVAPTITATEKFLARLGAAFPGTVWVGGCKNWYTSQQPTPVLWPLPQSEHKGFFEQVSIEDFDFTSTGQAD